MKGSICGSMIQRFGSISVYWSLRCCGGFVLLISFDEEPFGYFSEVGYPVHVYDVTERDVEFSILRTCGLPLMQEEGNPSPIRTPLY